LRVQIRVSGEEEELRELASLEDWLLDDPALRGCRTSLEAMPPGASDMGALSEVLIVALGSGGMGAALAASLTTWLRTRVSHVRIRIQTERGEIELDAKAAADPERMSEAVTKIIGESGIRAS
jgi:hypothetical protein